ncbi:hypothetical protein OOZ15_06445 [Galbibacter sp. EGI 63066]|uniref:hypothetical protein n=1 Tax=Galbibacter sp. EGI 63066 TaxID=2993559 RepID=UPI0022490776|nr:hypothetical protein [Galbibacter sp. EGI 63066]MCX2679579.1 hypothetical protein [Galbibacter sp. EGI 63066]
MKTLFLTLIFALTTMLTFAQTSEHLSFKDVPIDGTLDEYVSKIKKSGFSHLGTEDGTAILNGDFAGYKDCYVGVSTLKQMDLVSKIVVKFPEPNNWSFLSSNYFSLKEMLTEKYGEPSENVEKFDSFEPEDDLSKMIKVGLGECKYYAIYETEKGSIKLSIFGDISNHSVLLSYFDKLKGVDKKDRFRALKASNPSDLSLMNLFLMSLKDEDYEICEVANRLLKERGLEFKSDKW